MNWKERHLNWSWFLISFFAAPFIGGIAGILLDVGVGDSSLTELATFVISFVVIITATVWYLKRKNRSLGHLVWLILPFWGTIVLLCLKNLSGEPTLWLDEKKPLRSSPVLPLIVVLASAVFLLAVLLVIYNQSSSPTPISTPSSTQEPTPAPVSIQQPKLPFLAIKNHRYVYEDGAIHVGADGKPIELINNPKATNPTYAELAAFIKEDTTDSKDYIKPSEWGTPYARVCADFAEEVHNNAENKGIRAAWVSMRFREGGDGHALNAFETTDRGLVYVDGTGVSSAERLEQALKSSSDQTISSKPTSQDKVAYVEVGKEYGLIHIDVAKSPLYSFYIEYKQKRPEVDRLKSEYATEIIRVEREVETLKVRLDESEQLIDTIAKEYERMLSDYNSEVAKYNQEVKNNVYQEGSTELAAIKTWKLRVEEKGQALEKARQEYESLVYNYNIEVAKHNQQLQTWQARLEEKRRVIDELAEGLGEFWYEPLGIVTDVKIHWGNN